jgi:hypothetical protein
MKRISLVILAVILISPVFAAGNKTNPTLIVPKANGLKPSSVTPNPTEKASFTGQVWVSGVFIAQWPDPQDELHADDGLVVSIKLDKQEFKRLPYYDWPEWKERYVPNTVDIVDPEDAVKMVFPKAISTGLINRNLTIAKVHGRFLLGEYTVGVECDSPWAHAHLISASVKEVAETGGDAELSGC